MCCGGKWTEAECTECMDSVSNGETYVPSELQLEGVGEEGRVEGCAVNSCAVDVMMKFVCSDHRKGSD